MTVCDVRVTHRNVLSLMWYLLHKFTPVAKESVLPRIEDLFTSLADGIAFPKLDLSHTYLQLHLAKESQTYMAVNTTKGCISIIECHLELPQHQPFSHI